MSQICGGRAGLDQCAASLIAYDKKHHEPALFSDPSDPQMRGGTVHGNCLRFIASVVKSINGRRQVQGLPHQQFRLTDGAETTNGQIDDKPLDLSTWGADRYRGEPPPINYLVADRFALGAPGLLAAMGGAGKGMSMLDLAVKVGTDQYKHLQRS